MSIPSKGDSLGVERGKGGRGKRGGRSNLFEVRSSHAVILAESRHFGAGMAILASFGLYITTYAVQHSVTTGNHGS